MKRWFILMALMTLVGVGAQGVDIAPTDAKIRYTGRWNFDDPSVPWVAWQGSTIHVNFEGTGISIDIDAGTEEFRVVLDGVAESGRREFTSGRAVYELASGLADGPHSFVLMKETLWSKKTFFHGFIVDGDGLLPPSPRPALRIEYFGDSNMAGSSNYSEKNRGAMGTYYAFPAMVSRMLGAEMHNESVSGATLDGRGDNDVRSFIFSEDYENQDPAYRSGFDPHIIVVNAGANDIEGADKAAIKQRFRDVIGDLRRVYGDEPYIVLMNAYGWDENEPTNYSQDVVDEIGGNLSALHYAWLWELWHGCQWDHSGEAHTLVRHLAAINPAWKQVRENDIVDGFDLHGGFVNGSFEHRAPFGGFGWRYFTDGVERVHDSDGATDGEYFIRLEEGEKVHQPTDATGDLLPGATSADQGYEVRAMIRAATPGAKARIVTHFEGQTLYTHDDDPGTFQSTTFALSTDWKEYVHKAKASSGVWTLFNYLEAVAGTVEFDEVRLRLVKP